MYQDSIANGPVIRNYNLTASNAIFTHDMYASTYYTVNYGRQLRMADYIGFYTQNLFIHNISNDTDTLAIDANGNFHLQNGSLYAGDNGVISSDGSIVLVPNSSGLLDQNGNQLIDNNGNASFAQVKTPTIIDSNGSSGSSQQVLTQSGSGIQWASFPVSSSVQPVTSGTYVVLATDYYIGCNGTGIIIQLPSGANTGKQYVIKDESGNALINPVTILPAGTDLIDNSTSVSLFTNYMSLTLLWTGSRWSVI
jgi:hypothetical protein